MTEDESTDALTQFYTDHAIAKFKALQSNECSLLYCEDCDIEIPELRRNTLRGVTRCIDCQREHERALRGFS